MNNENRYKKFKDISNKMKDSKITSDLINNDEMPMNEIPIFTPPGEIGLETTMKESALPEGYHIAENGEIIRGESDNY